MKLSACLVIHNEEKVLARCLESIKNLSDEIIIIHDGPCRDRSLEIARQFNAQIYVEDFIGEAEFHRPLLFTKAKGEWLLSIDADEILNEEIRRKIPELIASNQCDAYSFSWPYPDYHGIISKGPFSKTVKPSLFRKKLAFMIGLSHEYPRTYGRSCTRLDFRIDHRPSYDNYSFRVFRKKWLRWAAIQAKQLNHLDRLPLFNISSKKDNPQINKLRKINQFPILTGFAETIKYVLLFLSRGILIAGTKSWKIAALEILYIWLVRFHLLKLKYG